MAKKRKAAFSHTVASLLFRRSCSPAPTDRFIQTMVGDAAGEAAARFRKSKIALDPMSMQVVFGVDRQYDDKGAEIKRPPRYVWVRVETTLLTESRSAPRAMCRNARGLLKPIHI